MRNKFFYLMKVLLALVMMVSLVLPESSGQAMSQKAAPQAQEASAGVPTDRIIIKFEDGSSAQSEPSASALMDSLSAAAGVPLQYARAMSGDAHVLQLGERMPIDQVEAISASLGALPGVEYAEPDRIKFPTLDPVPPDDAHYTNDQWDLWGPYGINAEAAWKLTQGSSSTVVAVIDTGITDHPEFSGRVKPGYDFITDITMANDGDGRDGTPSDPGDYFNGAPSSWHGTHVAGTIAAKGNNGVGIAGVDWNASILPVRVLGVGGGYDSDIIDGMRWAAGIDVAGVDGNQYPAKVLNLSLGGYGACGSFYQTAINEIVNIRKAVVVVSAGNSSADASAYSPANCNNVITVAATSVDGKLASYSNYGSTVEISAPGDAIYSTWNDGTTTPNVASYKAKYGTSMAAPHVSGVVSLLFAVNPDFTPAQILDILQKTATTFPTGTGACTTSTCGAGIVNAAAVLPDLVITNVTLSRTYPSLGDELQVNITIKNQGGSNTSPIGEPNVRAHLYVDRNPMGDASAIPAVAPLYIDPQGGAVYVEEGGDEYEGDFHLESSPQIKSLPAGESVTYALSINRSVSGENPNIWTSPTSPVSWGDGTHKLYAYVDSDGSVAEGLEKNNHFAAVTINPYVPGALIYPEHGQIIGANYRPTFKWNKWDSVNGKTPAEQYQIYVTTAGGTVIYSQWHQAASVCDTTSNICSLELGPAYTLGGGTYGWYIRAYSVAGGYTSWSNNTNPTSFTTVSVPGAVSLIYPAQGEYIGADYTPNFTWQVEPTTSHYRLYVINAAGSLVWDKWYLASEKCVGSTCSVKEPVLGGGGYGWYIQAYNPAGSGPWSNNTQAFKFTTSTSKPLPATLIYPGQGEYIGTNYQPTFRWNKVVGVTHYRLYVTNAGGVVWNKWYSLSDPALSCGDTECSVKDPTLSGGAYGWYVQTYSPAGYGDWSNNTQAFNFTTSTTKPLPATLIYPGQGEDIGSAYQTTFRWNKVDGVTHYRLYVTNAGGVVWNKWYPVLNSALSCGDTECSVKEPVLGGGGYGWYIQTYSPAGYGDWSNNTQAFNFTTYNNKPGTPILIDPVDEQNLGKIYKPTFQWSAVDGATYYRIYVVDPASSVILNQWFLVSLLTCDATSCSLVSPITLTMGGRYGWYVQAYGPGGYSDWSNGTIATDFDVDEPTVPKAATNLAPTDTIADTTPTFSWKMDPMATWYRLYVKGPTGVVYDKWNMGASVCIGDSCEVTTTVLPAGNYTWWVQTYGVKGYGPWKSATLKIAP